MSFDHGLLLVNGVSVLNGFLAHFMSIFSCFWSFFAAYLCNFSTFVVCLKQFLPLLSNLQVNFNDFLWVIQGKFFPILPIYWSIILYQQSYTKHSYFPKIFKMPIKEFFLFIYLYIYVSPPLRLFQLKGSFQ